MLKAALLISFLLPITLFSQNLVPNGGFEEYEKCPDSANKASYYEKETWEYGPKYWYQPSCGTPDYCNKCSSHPLFNARNARSGNGCISIIAYDKSENMCREYATVNLSSPLVANESYCVKFYVALRAESELVCSYLSAYIGYKLDWRSTIIPISFASLIYNTTPFLTDTSWVEISGIYKAKGGETTISIGNFSENEVGGKIRSKERYNATKAAKGYPHAYYMIDDVSLTHITNEFECSSIGKPIALNNIFFDTNKSILLPSSSKELDKLAGYLKDRDTILISIGGHTDSIGNTAANDKLSNDRAKAVADYLISKGINKKRITFKGYGSTKPVDSNATEKGRQRNRRVEFVLSRK